MMAASQRSYIIFFRVCISGTMARSGKAFVLVFPFGEDFGDNADDVYAGREGGIGHQAHQAFTAAAIDRVCSFSAPM